MHKVFVSAMFILLTSACVTQPVLKEGNQAAEQFSSVSSPSLENSSESLTKCSVFTVPTYPLLSRLFKEEGKVILRLELDEGGRISATNVVSSSGSTRLDEAAIAAAKKWRCDPVERNGQSVRAVALQPFNFLLQSPATVDNKSQFGTLRNPGWRK
jgi:TonB family protein